MTSLNLDVLIIGAGLSGIDAAVRLQQLCPTKTWAIVEGRERLGGTWDLFRYPGIRSDSDMYTLAYPFKPWTDPQAIAGGQAILDYLDDTAREYGVHEKIHYGQRVTSANWDSERAQWRVTAQTADGAVEHTARFVYLGTGYYDYDRGHVVDFPGQDDFTGQIVHPQFWPEGLEVAGRRVVIIGSGATAVTLLPALVADGATHVSMLQRTPTWYFIRPAKDALANFLPLDRLPRLLWSTDIAGHVTAEAACETGLAIGTPVTCGTIDAAAEAVSVGVQSPGEMMMMYGSTIFMIQITERPVRDPRLWYAPWLFPGLHASMAGLATSGTLTHWFRDQLARDADFAALTAEAEVSPKGAKGLICLPYFSGERTPIHDPAAKGAFFGLDLTHSRGDMFRAVLEGIAAGTAHVVETYAEAGAVARRVLAVGGGTKNAVWMQATSDMCGVPQEVRDKTLGASYGNAFLAAVAVGAASPEEITAWNPVARMVTPEEVPVYRRQYPLWKALYAQSRDIAHALGES